MLPYYSFNQYLKERFGESVWRVTIEGGFDCPNRVGERGFGGCTFCTADGSSSRAQSVLDSISDQLKSGITKQKKRHRAKKFIAYLQSFTNTYAPLSVLKRIYDQAIDHPEVVMLAIGTRPDCLADEVIELINSYTERLEVWVDLGLQSIDDRILERVNRGHTVAEFFDSIERLHKIAPGIKICTHLIAGLPGEDHDLEYGKTFEGAKLLADLPIHGIKIHNLCILKGTKLAHDHAVGLINPVQEDAYIDLLCRIVPILPPDLVIHRLMGEAPAPGELIAPLWADEKDLFLIKLREKLRVEGIFQGRDHIEQEKTLKSDKSPANPKKQASLTT
ncbi:MAG: TIGR01212 family radical SAM protein [Candidatus Caenarcaniphilales bacterium]|nr:TIGR01212 family radical SAM protein [Candidatus Caenarcaniphilales bacterium]